MKKEDAQMAAKELPTSYKGEDKNKPPFSNSILATMTQDEADKLYDGGALLRNLDQHMDKNPVKTTNKKEKHVKTEIGGRGD
jgi:hypothetical protein